MKQPEKEASCLGQALSILLNLLLHVRPSELREYPGRQEHVNDPTVLTQTCWQLSASSEHSLMSVQVQKMGYREGYCTHTTLTPGMSHKL